MTRVRTVVIIGLVLLFLGLATARTEFFIVFYAITLVLVMTYFWARLALSRVQSGAPNTRPPHSGGQHVERDLHHSQSRLHP